MTVTARTLQVVDLDWVRKGLAARDKRREEEADDEDAQVKIIAFANGKGGVGKSSTSSAFAVAASRHGLRVLLVELDQQGNNAEDLGFVGGDIADDGAAQAAMVLKSEPLRPTGFPRKNLAVLPGGEALEEVTEELYVQRRLARETGDTAWLGMYAAAFEQVYDDYDLIILDVAPGSLVLQLQALVAADAVIIPSKSDPSSRKGLRLVARRFREARMHNELLSLLGVVLFATGTAATRVRTEIRRQLETDLQGAAPVFRTPIRHVEAVAVQARLRGLVPEELAGDDQLDTGMRKTANDLATDYRALTSEILIAIRDLREQLNQLDDSPSESEVAV